MEYEMKKFTKIAITAAIAGLSIAAQAGLVIDDFSVDQTFLSDTTTDGTGFASSSVTSTSILGGDRDLFVIRTGGTGTQPVSTGVETDILSFASPPNVNGYAVVRWDGTESGITDGGAYTQAAFDATNVFGLSANLNDYGDAFQLSIVFADMNFPFRLTAYTDAANYTFLDLFSFGPGTYTLSFADFLADGTSVGGGVNFFNVGALEGIMNTGGLITAVDLQIAKVEVVPEPGSLALVGLAVLALGAARRRKSVK